jgi:hypothetical protein
MIAMLILNNYNLREVKSNIFTLLKDNDTRGE